MTAKPNEFHIVTRWQVQAGIAEVADILTDAEHLPDWWGRVYLGVTVTDPGGPDQIGRTVAVHSKGWLPYHIRWSGRLVSADLPHTWEIAATGDLEGHGIWTLRQTGPVAEVTYDWRVKAERPLLRLLSPLLAPVFAWNHRWAMAQGEAGLRAELARLRAIGRTASR